MASKRKIYHFIEYVNEKTLLYKCINNTQFNTKVYMILHAGAVFTINMFFVSAILYLI